VSLLARNKKRLSIASQIFQLTPGGKVEVAGYKTIYNRNSSALPSFTTQRFMPEEHCDAR